MPAPPFDAFAPDADGLLRKISGRIDDAMLQDIAAADRGFDSDVHLSQLRRMRDESAFAAPLRHYPLAVIERIRDRDPDDPEAPVGGRGLRGHWLRAFACALLLRASGQDGNPDLRADRNAALIQLIGSLHVLDAGLDRDAAGLVAWLLAGTSPDPADGELCFLAVGLLWLALLSAPSPADEDIVALAQWIIDREAIQARDHGKYFGRWLLGTSLFDQGYSGWERLGAALVDLDLGRRSPTARGIVKLIGRELAGR